MFQFQLFKANTSELVATSSNPYVACLLSLVLSAEFNIHLKSDSNKLLCIFENGKIVYSYDTQMSKTILNNIISQLIEKNK